MARWACVAALAVLSACGGGGSSSSRVQPTTTSLTPQNAPVGIPATSLQGNAVPLVVDKGTDGSSVNSPFVTVTVCVPGSSTCQSIDHVLVDTGSYGLRIVASALGAAGSLPAVHAPNGSPLAECAGFVSGFAWGSVRTADVQIGGETALGAPVHVVDDGTPVPAACSNTGPSMGVGAGAKGVLGIGFLKQDCGTACVTSTAPQVYFSCTAGGCVPTLAPLASQVTNPVALFATDSNGVAITLPDVPLGGTSAATGQLVFGVGTAANNQLGSAQVFTANASGMFTTVYKGNSLSGFIDSGSNGIFMHDLAITSCASGFFCPPATLSLTATVVGVSGASRDVPFTVENLATLPGSPAAAHLAGDVGSTRSFDWGLPFFFGRTVFIARQGASTPSGTGPFWAF